jgi:hypothetical protein
MLIGVFSWFYVKREALFNFRISIKLGALYQVGVQASPPPLLTISAALVILSSKIHRK